MFNIALEEVVRKVQETTNGVSFNRKVYALLVYADDVVVPGSNEEDIKNTLEADNRSVKYGANDKLREN